MQWINYKMKNKSVFFISDRTAITTEALGNALLTQFEGVKFNKCIMPFIDSQGKAERSIIKIHDKYLQDGNRPIVLTSIINQELRSKFKLPYVLHVDFFESYIPMLEEEIGVKVTQKVGMSHGIGNEDTYYKRIEAIDYSIYNDDGVSFKSYDIADVILIGISRVGKTPTCLYLAVNYGLKAANYPITEQDFRSEKLPKVLIPYHSKLFGLTIETEKLHHIRSHRLPNSTYSNIKTCQYEVEAAERIMHNNDVPFLNTSKKSIEEISVAIMQLIHIQRKF
jgi:[pyruvate, water dikinase]-phosphate phosphotransferase / [pyruvate, water dikinase] kinase